MPGEGRRVLRSRVASAGPYEPPAAARSRPQHTFGERQGLVGCAAMINQWITSERAIDGAPRANLA